MAVKLSFGEPVAVAAGPTYDEAGWGPYQFPQLFLADSGELLLSFADRPDDDQFCGLPAPWYVSRDQGKTWAGVAQEDRSRYISLSGTRLPDGKRLRPLEGLPVPMDRELHQTLMKRARHRSTLPTVGLEEVPEGLVTATWQFSVSEPGSAEETVYHAPLDFPGLMVQLLPNGTVQQPWTYGSLPRVAPDGSLWLPFYNSGRNPENMGRTGYYAAYFLQSTDGGKTWKLRSWIPYLPDTKDHPNAFLAEGFCEQDLTWTPDGSMVTVLRTHHFYPSYLARSTDGGATWSKPVQFDRCGVYPRLLTLGCGVTLCSYGRPGLFVRATADPAGLRWEAPCTLISPEGIATDSFRSFTQDPKTCSYTALLPLDDRTALMAYTDFTVKDEQGVARKTVLVRTVHVDGI